MQLVLKHFCHFFFFNIAKMFARAVCKMSPWFSYVNCFAEYTGYVVDDIS